MFATCLLQRRGFRAIWEDLCTYQRQLEPNPAVTGSSCAAHRVRGAGCAAGCAAGCGCPAVAGQDASLKTTLCGGFCYCFSEQEQHVHIPSWKLLADFLLVGKQAIALEVMYTLLEKLGRANCTASAACCLDTISSVRLPAC